jgi:hypothetical protein
MTYQPAVNAPMALPVAVPSQPSHPQSHLPQAAAFSHPSLPLTAQHQQAPQPQPQQSLAEAHAGHATPVTAPTPASPDALSADEDLQQLIKLMSKHGMMEKLHMLMQLKKPDHQG